MTFIPDEVDVMVCFYVNFNRIFEWDITFNMGKNVMVRHFDFQSFPNEGSHFIFQLIFLPLQPSFLPVCVEPNVATLGII